METTRLRPEDRSPEVAGIRQQVLALVDTLEPATAAAIAGLPLPLRCRSHSHSHSHSHSSRCHCRCCQRR